MTTSCSSTFPANRILCGSGALGTELREPGCCISTEVKGTLVHFGALENGPVTDKAGAHLAEVFTKGGCLAEFNEDDRPNVWKKVIINCTVNTVCAVLRLKIYEVAQDEFGMQAFPRRRTGSLRDCNGEGRPVRRCRV